MCWHCSREAQRRAARVVVGHACGLSERRRYGSTRGAVHAVRVRASRLDAPGAVRVRERGVRAGRAVRLLGQVAWKGGVVGREAAQARERGMELAWRARGERERGVARRGRKRGRREGREEKKEKEKEKRGKKKWKKKEKEIEEKKMGGRERKRRGGGARQRRPRPRSATRGVRLQEVGHAVGGERGKKRRARFAASGRDTSRRIEKWMGRELKPGVGLFRRISGT